MTDKLTDTERLNEEVKTRIAPSKIHGVGEFALRDLHKGEKLYADRFPVIYRTKHAFFGWLRPEVSKLLLERWPNIVNGSQFMWPDTNIQAYMNHSEDANYDAVNDVMLKSVKEGEEITENYRAINGYAQVFPWLTKS
jgi:hypothetical protein